MEWSFAFPNLLDSLIVDIDSDCPYAAGGESCRGTKSNVAHSDDRDRVRFTIQVVETCLSGTIKSGDSVRFSTSFSGRFTLEV